MRYFFLAYLLAAVLVVGFAGLRGDKFSHTPFEILPDMDQQPKVKAQQSNDFFADRVGGRKPVAGTVPIGLRLADKTAADGGYQEYGFGHAGDYYGWGRAGDYYNTGAIGDFYGDGFPQQIKVDMGLINLGHERYDIYCSRCHGEAGNGKGVLSKHGVANIFDFHSAPFSKPDDPAYRPNGLVFEVITRGKGLMGAYGANIPVKERWAIIAWLRTMAMARTAPVSDPAVKAIWDSIKPKEEAKPEAPAPPKPVAAN